MSLQNKRGGRIFLQDIRVCTDTFSTFDKIIVITASFFGGGCCFLRLSVEMQAPIYDAIIISLLVIFKK